MDDQGVTKAEAIASFHKSLGIGSRGNDVIVLQSALEQKGLLIIPQGVAKGFFGTLTRGAVVKYQSSTSLPTVGVFGPLTRAKLISELGE
jgi:peptidoglycan hydrolase-like protein with peptidoglycan-binding domain